MARIGDYELRGIKNKILDDLYLKREDEFRVRQTAIAKQSREYYLAPIQYLIDQLPVEMVSHDSDYQLRIKYTPSEDKSNISIDEKWVYKAETPIVNQVDSISRGSYNHTPENKLDERLWGVTEQLCKDMLALRAEREEQKRYLDKTTQMYTGSLQLRKVWPEALHKYLPNEPIKLERKIRNAVTGKLVKSPDPIVPESLKTRLTTNLLEDN
jgi:hypothetical protein